MNASIDTKKESGFLQTLGIAYVRVAEDDDDLSAAIYSLLSGDM